MKLLYIIKIKYLILDYKNKIFYFIVQIIKIFIV